MNALQDRVAVVTGASRGIGRAAALALARAGAHVVLIARTVGGLEETDDLIRQAGGAATLVPLDLDQLDRIDPLGPHLLQRFGRCDILLGNAGVLGTLGPLTHHDAKQWEWVMRVNVHANWRLIRTLDPLLRKSDAGRAVFVTSGAAIRPQAYWGAYATTKAALDMMVKVYAAETEGTAIRVNLLSPGPIRSAMRLEAFPGEDPESVRPPDVIAPLLVELCAPAETRHGAWIDASKLGR